MTIDFNGTIVSACVAGDRTHEFRLPLDRSRVPAATLETLNAMEAAADKERKAKTPTGRQEAAEALREAVHDVYDRAASTSRKDRDTHQEGYAYGVAKLARALGEAQAALQLMADHAQQYDNGTGVGFKLDRRRSKAVMQIQLIADTLSSAPSPLDLDGGEG